MREDRSVRARRLAVGLALVASAACGGGGGGGGGPTAPPPPPPPPPTTGTISGTVSAAGAGVSGAQVALGSGGTQTTSSSGQYSFANVAAGSHSLTLTLPTGFALAAGEAASKTTTVTAGQTATVNWSLSSTGQVPQSVEIALEAARFNPSDVTIARGGTVRWVNAESIAHTITPASGNPAGGWQSQNVPAQSGFSFSHTFNSAGTFNYNCTLHAGMSGVVRVQ